MKLSNAQRGGSAMIQRRMSLLLLVAVACAGVSNAKHQKPVKMTLQPTRPTTLSISSAISLAHKHRPDLCALQHAIQERKMEARALLSEYYPQVGLESRYVQSRGEKNPSGTTVLEARQLIYQFGGPLEKYRQAKKVTRVQEFISDAERNQIQHEVEQAFLQSWLLQRQEESIKKLYNSTREVFAKATHENELKLLNKSDWLKSASDHAAELSQVDTYQDSMIIAERKLEFLLGQSLELTLVENKISSPERTTLEWNEHQTIELAPRETYYQAAIKHRLDLKIGDKNIEIARDGAKIACQANMPTTFAFANVSHLHNPSVEGVPGMNGFHQVGIGVRWNIFDGALTHFKTGKAEASKMRAILEKDSVIQKIRFEVEAAYRELSKSVTTLKAKDIELIKTKNDLELSEQRFAIGDISKVELSTAKTAWEQAYLSWRRAKIDAALRKSDLLFACGYPPSLN